MADIQSHRSEILPRDFLKSVRGIMLSRPDRIGDVIISSSCLRAVKERFPDAKLYWLVRESMRPLFFEHPGFTELIPLPETDIENRLSEVLVEKQIDVVVHLEAHREVEAAAAKAGIGQRIGFSLLGEQHLTHPVPYEKKKGEKLEALYNFDLLRLLGVESPEKLQPWITINPQAEKRAEHLLKEAGVSAPFAAFHLSAHGKKPIVPPELMAQIASWLIREKGFAVCLLGMEADKPEERLFLKHIGQLSDAVFNLCGRTHLDESAAILQRAVVMVTRDSGPAHLSAALGTPTVTFIVEPSPEKKATRWHPLGDFSWVIENDIPRRWWESDYRFARRSCAQLRFDAILPTVKTALAAKS